MKLLIAVLLLTLVATASCQDEEKDTKESWWSTFKSRVKNVLSKWKDDIKLLWDEVLTKADDMRGWTSEMFDVFKQKMKEWVETRPEVPDDEKNEIENFISKLKVPTDKPKGIDP